MSYQIYIFAWLHPNFQLSRNKDDTVPQLSEADQEAIEAMNIQLEKAEAYNDSLRMCCEGEKQCTDSIRLHYDERLHRADSLYLHHNQNFSHNEMFCDHSHRAGMHRHSGEKHRNMNRHHERRQVHTMEDHERMQRIMDEHCFNH